MSTQPEYTIWEALAEFCTPGQRDKLIPLPKPDVLPQRLEVPPGLWRELRDQLSAGKLIATRVDPETVATVEIPPATWDVNYRPILAYSIEQSPDGYMAPPARRVWEPGSIGQRQRSRVEKLSDLPRLEGVRIREVPDWQPQPGTIRIRIEAGRWFRGRALESPDTKPATRAAILGEMRELFPGLSARAAREIWKMYAPESWSKGGRLPKRSA